MFALGIIDKLTPGALTDGKIVAGTGTIDAKGNIGEIGGIQQKLVGAKDAGAVLFLAPQGNCDDVIGHIPDGLTVASVATLEDAMTAINDFNDGKPVKLCSVPS
jgi:PDZ domain-containing protein